VAIVFEYDPCFFIFEKPVNRCLHTWTAAKARALDLNKNFSIILISEFLS
jgi:hypothetical protein